jgi:DNA-binding response OmpR family regulator
MAKNILLVDADDLLRPSLAAQLAQQGFTVVEAASAATVLARTSGVAPDAVVIDALLPAAADLCGRLRERDGALPIVVLGAGDPAAATAFRTAGASECIAKPYRLAHLAQRLLDHLRQAVQEASIVIGGCRFYAQSRLLVDGGGNRVRLTEKEAAILVYLHRAGARAVPRDELLGEVWGYNGAVSTHTVETHMHRLRRKLGDDTASLLCTEGGGYRLSAMSTATGT